MSEMSLSQLFGDIADAIREVDGTTEPITATDFPARISRLSAPLPPNIYGVEWDGSESTEWTRTDDAADFADPIPSVANGSGSSPFDTLMPWAGMVRVTDEVAGELVAIPKFWYKLTQDGPALKLQISDKAVEGFNVSPAHADRGDGVGERDIVYVGRYHCDTSYESRTQVLPANSRNINTSRAQIHAKGESYYQWDWAMVWTIRFLYLVEFASWHSQAKIGRGCSAEGARALTGQTDASSYHTGTTGETRDEYGFTQYRNIEGLWDNLMDLVDGCYYGVGGLYVQRNPEQYNDANMNTNGGINVSNSGTQGYASAFAVCENEGFEWCIYPIAANGSANTYVTDIWSYSSDGSAIIVGAPYAKYDNYGLFAVSTTSNNGNSFAGCRLMKLP